MNGGIEQFDGREGAGSDFVKMFDVVSFIATSFRAWSANRKFLKGVSTSFFLWLEPFSSTLKRAEYFNYTI